MYDTHRYKIKTAVNIGTEYKNKTKAKKNLQVNLQVNMVKELDRG